MYDESATLLRDVPNDAWQREWDALMQDPWLRRKLDRKRRLVEHTAYLSANAPDVLTAEPGVVIDIGPGGGETLEICRVLGHDVLGIDAPTGAGGMGANYLRASQLICQRQGIPVRYSGLMGFLDDVPPRLLGQCVLINSRGSIEQAMSEFMDGEPHHEHHDCRQMRWRHTDQKLYYAFHKMFRTFYRLLRPGGMVLIHANGSHPDTHDFYEASVLAIACEQGFFHPETAGDKGKLHLWRKRRE